MPEHLHFVPGRLRLKISQLKHPGRAAEAERYLAATAGITSVTANPVTGSLTIHFDSREISIAVLWKALQKGAYVSSPCPQPIGVGYASPDGTRTGQLADAVIAAFAESIARHTAAALIRAML